MLKITTAILMAFALWIGRAEASSSRTIDADSLTSSDHTKTYSLPAASDTLTGAASTNTLTNKTISGATNTLTAIPVAVQMQTDNFSGNGTTTAFTLSYAPPATTGIVATLDGLVLTIGSGNDFTISGTTFTMTTAPASGQTLKVIYSQY